MMITPSTMVICGIGRRKRGNFDRLGMEAGSVWYKSVAEFPLGGVFGGRNVVLDELVEEEEDRSAGMVISGKRATGRYVWESRVRDWIRVMSLRYW